jgi:hypothetical protein
MVGKKYRILTMLHVLVTLVKMKCNIPNECNWILHLSFFLISAGELSGNLPWCWLTSVHCSNPLDQPTPGNMQTYKNPSSTTHTTHNAAALSKVCWERGKAGTKGLSYKGCAHVMGDGFTLPGMMHVPSMSCRAPSFASHIHMATGIRFDSIPR